jgi:hypothetical protein
MWLIKKDSALWNEFLCILKYGRLEVKRQNECSTSNRKQHKGTATLMGLLPFLCTLLYQCREVSTAVRGTVFALRCDAYIERCHISGFALL